MKYYFDTSIWRDYFDNRNDKFRPLGEWAFGLIKKIIKDKGIILYSQLVIDELRKGWSQETIDKCLGFFRSEGLLVKVEADGKQIIESKTIARKKAVPKGDALHAVLARDNDAIMVARDHHFIELDCVTEHKKPEELI
jgi:hypothetical protein